MERGIKKLIERLAAWRPFSFLDRFVYVEALPGLYGWTEKNVDAVNQKGMATGIIKDGKL